MNTCVLCEKRKFYNGVGLFCPLVFQCIKENIQEEINKDLKEELKK